jgi:hypothetical protein
VALEPTVLELDWRGAVALGLETHLDFDRLPLVGYRLAPLD